jgi:hypothetical protein
MRHEIRKYAANQEFYPAHCVSQTFDCMIAADATESAASESQIPKLGYSEDHMSVDFLRFAR